MDPNESAGAVQPDEGQGASAGSEGLYPDLSTLDSATREMVTPHLKTMEGNITRKLQEAAEYRKQWEPYTDLGLNDMDPGELQELLSFGEIARDPDQFRQWYEAVGQEMGFANGNGNGAEQDATPEFSPDAVTKMIGDALDQRLGPIQSAYEAQEQQRQEQEIVGAVTGKLDELQSQHGEFDRDAVNQLAVVYAQQGAGGPDGAKDAIERGFADYQRLIGNVEKGVFKRKLNTPETPEQGGRPATQAQPITSFGDAHAAAKALFRQGSQV